MLKTVDLAELIAGKTPITVETGISVLEACQVMSEANKGAIMVLDNDKLVGIFTERDLLRRVIAEGLNPQEIKVENVMTESLVVGSPSDSYQRGLQKMISANCRHLPLVKGDKVVGLVSRRDLMELDIHLMEDELDRRDPATLFV